MKLIYFVRPILHMFDFKGRTGRAEYFTYTVPSSLVACFAFVAATVLMGPAGMNLGIDFRFLNTLGGPLTKFLLPPAVVFVTQFPMLALTVRRLRDQRASGAALLWFFAPWVGPLALFFYGFPRTFHDYITTLPDGRTMWLSEWIDERRRQSWLVATGIVVVSLIALADMAAGSGSASYVSSSGGGGKRAVKGSPWKADGSINNRNNILGGRKAHMRGGGAVRASKNKYTWN